MSAFLWILLLLNNHVSKEAHAKPPHDLGFNYHFAWLHNNWQHASSLSSLSSMDTNNSYWQSSRRAWKHDILCLPCVMLDFIEIMINLHLHRLLRNFWNNLIFLSFYGTVPATPFNIESTTHFYDKNVLWWW